MKTTLTSALRALKPRLHDRYVARTVLMTLLLVWAVLVGFDATDALRRELDEVGDGGYTFTHALLYILFTIPRRLYELFPSAAVIGSILGLGGLAATSELTALRASGISRLRICLGAALTLVVLTTLMVVNGETLGPAGEARATAIVVSAKTKDLAVARFSGLWARDGKVFVNIPNGGIQRGFGEQSWVDLSDVRMYSFDDDGRLTAIARARSAELRPAGQTSVLRDVKRTRFGENTATLETHKQEVWRTGLDGESLAASMVRPRYLSTAKLGQTIEYLDRNKLDAGPFRSIYWARWFYAINVFTLCLAAMPFAFGQLRTGGFGKRLFLGILFGLSFYLLQRLLTNLADVYHVDLRLANAIPPAILAGLAWWQYRRRA